MGYYPPQQPPAYPPPYPPPYTPRQNSTTATLSLIAGILGWTFLPGLGSLIAIITGHMAKGEIKNSGGMIGGDGAATWGLLLGYSFIIVSACTACIVGGIWLAAMLGLFAVAGSQSSGLILFLLV